MQNVQQRVNAENVRHGIQKVYQRGDLVKPKRGATLPMMPTLTAMRPPVRASTMGHC